MTRITRKELQYLQECQKSLADEEVKLQLTEGILSFMADRMTGGMYSAMGFGGGDDETSDLDDSMEDVTDAIEDIKDVSADLLDYVEDLLGEVKNETLAETMKSSATSAVDTIKGALTSEFEKITAAMGTGGAMDDEEAATAPRALASAVMAGAMAQVLTEFFAE